ncbi:response regulator [Sphingomonas montanisoli]|uniref:Response regulator n=1 Tax=Sphingomonas montanisoli TaxID=2606412 RepID=A0A5D9C7M4_9SPHN|nr:response regulator [Sphingomonas montanisoli]TZG26001.1 response regulator [Sphingomonas montanisoli]
MMYGGYDLAPCADGLMLIRASAAIIGHPDSVQPSAGGMPRTREASALDELTFDARMLFVEDDEHIADVIGIMLEDLGFDLVHVPSGEDALAMIDRDKDGFDIVMTDVIMGGISGVSLAKKVRSMHPALPIILASGYSDEIVGGYNTGFELIRKPFSRRELIACLARHLKADGAA